MRSIPKIRTRYEYPTSTGLVCLTPSLTQQHLGPETDINTIIRRAVAAQDYAVFTPTKRAEYYDCSTFTDYQESVNFLNGIEDDFDSLPSQIRAEFGHNLSNYVKFMTDPQNAEKAVELGLLTTSKPPQTPASEVVPVVPAVAPKSVDVVPVLPSSDA